MAALQSNYSINPPPPPPTIVITIQLHEFDRSRSGELKDKLEEDAKEWAKEVLGDGIEFQVDVRIVA